MTLNINTGWTCGYNYRSIKTHLFLRLFFLGGNSPVMGSSFHLSLHPFVFSSFSCFSCAPSFLSSFSFLYLFCPFFLSYNSFAIYFLHLRKNKVLLSEREMKWSVQNKRGKNKKKMNPHRLENNTHTHTHTERNRDGFQLLANQKDGWRRVPSNQHHHLDPVSR